MTSCTFEDTTTGSNLSKEFIPAIEKGFHQSTVSGPQTGFPVINTKFVLTDGDQHAVDSSSNAFMAAARGAFREAFKQAGPVLLQPHMKVEVHTPTEYQSAAINSLSKRKAQIQDVLVSGDMTTVYATAPLAHMFGYMTELRGFSKGLAEFNMEFHQHLPLDEQDRLVVLNKFKDQFEKKKNNEI